MKIKGGTVVRLLFLIGVLALLIFVRVWPWQSAATKCRAAYAAARTRSDSLAIDTTQMPMLSSSRYPGNHRHTLRCDALIRSAR
jgi:hypothetical protein